MQNTLVSIIIPTKNSSSTIEECLLSIKKQSYSNIETIVVDNHSTDSTQIISQKYTDKFYTKGPERTFQKNHGIEKSTGEYLCFIDSDMILTENVIQECISLMESDEIIGGICIPERSIWKWILPIIRDFERSFYKGTPIESARFFRKSNVLLVGGFEEDIIFFEESLLPQKIEKILHLKCHSNIESAILHQEWEISLIKWFWKKFYYGKSLWMYQEKVAKIWLKEVWEGQISVLWRYRIFLRNKRFYSKPLLAIWVLFLKTLEFSAGGLWFLISKISNNAR